jgi:hypothetical protein
MNNEWKTSLKEKLDQHYAWPAVYTFKFIVPKGKEEQIKVLFPQHDSSEKVSKNGNYVSVTFQMMMPGSDAIVAVYEAASAIEGVIAL